MNWKALFTQIWPQILALIGGQVEKQMETPEAPIEIKAAPIQHVTLKELNPHEYPTTPEIDANLQTLLERVNVIRNEWNKPMTVTSGLRSEADQQRINPSAPKSKHLLGAAVDIYDPGLLLTAWLKENNSQRLINAKLWCEEGNKDWVHFQCIPPNSGNIWFIP